MDGTARTSSRTRTSASPAAPTAAQQMIAILFTILGNLDDLEGRAAKLEDNFDAAPSAGSRR